MNELLGEIQGFLEKSANSSRPVDYSEAMELHDRIGAITLPTALSPTVSEIEQQKVVCQHCNRVTHAGYSYKGTFSTTRAALEGR
jgi:hypothetical protein